MSMKGRWPGHWAPDGREGGTGENLELGRGRKKYERSSKMLDFTFK